MKLYLHYFKLKGDWTVKNSAIVTDNTSKEKAFSLLSKELQDKISHYFYERYEIRPGMMLSAFGYDRADIEVEFLNEHP